MAPTVIVMGPLPALAEKGLRFEITSSGAIVKLGPVATAPFVTTVMVAVPGAFRSLAGTAACRLLELSTVVDSGLPFQFTTEVEAKFEPETLSVNAGAPTAAN